MVKEAGLELVSARVIRQRVAVARTLFADLKRHPSFFQGVRVVLDGISSGLTCPEVDVEDLGCGVVAAFEERMACRQLTPISVTAFRQGMALAIDLVTSSRVSETLFRALEEEASGRR